MSFVERKRTKLLGLPMSFTKYIITGEKLTITTGFLSITEDDAYMYKIQDVRLTRSLCERLFKLGTITCYTGDTTHPELVLYHVKMLVRLKTLLWNFQRRQGEKEGPFGR